MRYLLYFAILAYLASCKKNTDAPTVTLTETVDTTAKLLASGIFQKGPYGTVSGKGELYKNPNGTYAVVLDSFTTTNGPDLYVYLSKQAMPVDFIEAGKLKSTSGRQVYDLDMKPDTAQFKYISIHCKAYNHLFGYALLK
ncbi:MAG: DM13 domain-containing protein [Chitinophagaceae bacterium]